jgi:hypothetical protein
MFSRLMGMVKRCVDTSPRLGASARRVKRSAESSKVGDIIKLRERRFNKAFETCAWTRTGESVSGSGSSLAATEKLRTALPQALRDLGVKTLLDVPCGDWNWMSHVDLPVERYIGGDIVIPLIRRNQKRFGNSQRIFEYIDLCKDELPDSDLLLCRDALIHFSYKDIWRVIANITRAKIEFIATTTFPDTNANQDQSTGIPWRHINLESSPFNFPQPLIKLVDDYNRPDQILAFWRIAELPKKQWKFGA